MDVHSHFGRTPLYSAAFYGDLKMVWVLLKYNTDANARSDTGWTVLHQRYLNSFIPNVYRSLCDVARLLLEYDADVNAQISDSALSGSTPLHIAIKSNRVEVACVLLEHGVNINVEDSCHRQWGLDANFTKSKVM